MEEIVLAHHERRSGEFSVGGLAPAWRVGRARGLAAIRAPRRVFGAARLWLQQRKPDGAGADAGVERVRLRDAALRHARLRQERRRVWPRHLPRTGRGFGQCARLSQPASRRRSRPHRRHRLELRRRGRGLCRRRQSAPRRGRLQRRLGPRRAQIPRPASHARSLGEIHRNARRGPRPSRPHRQIADGAALRHRADPRHVRENLERQKVGMLAPNSVEMFPAETRKACSTSAPRRSSENRAAAAALDPRRQQFGDADRAVDRDVQARRPAARSCICSVGSIISCSPKIPRGCGKCCAIGSTPICRRERNSYMERARKILVGHDELRPLHSRRAGRHRRARRGCRRRRRRIGLGQSGGGDGHGVSRLRAI